MCLILSLTGDDGMNMGLNPMTNDQPLQFNSNKGPTIQMGGEQSAGGNDYDQKGNGWDCSPLVIWQRGEGGKRRGIAKDQQSSWMNSLGK